MRRFLLISALIPGLFTAPAVAAGDWRVVPGESRIGFVATYEDTPFDAWFRSFDAQIRFAPGELDDASFDVRIDLASVDSNSRDRDRGMKQPEWLAADEHPVARFQSTRFEKISGNRFRAVGTLRLKDVSRSIGIPFTWEQSGGRAVLKAEAELSRGDFNIGTGEWSQDDTIGFAVQVKARLRLRRE